MRICECSVLPGKKYYTDTQFSTNKKDSIPFLGLDAGIHTVEFRTYNRSIVREIKVWYSMFGWAWIILGKFVTGVEDL